MQEYYVCLDWFPVDLNNSQHCEVVAYSFNVLTFHVATMMVLVDSREGTPFIMNPLFPLFQGMLLLLPFLWQGIFQHVKVAGFMPNSCPFGTYILGYYSILMFNA